MLAMWPSANEGMVPKVGLSTTSPLPSESTVFDEVPKLPEPTNESALAKSELYPPERKMQSSAGLSDGADCASASPKNRPPERRGGGGGPPRPPGALSSGRRGEGG